MAHYQHTAAGSKCSICGSFVFDEKAHDKEHKTEKKED